MHKDGPVTRLPIHAVPGKQPGLRVFLLMLGASILCATALAAPAPKAKPAAAPAKETAPAATFVGADTCGTCHANVAKSFATNPHTKMLQMPGNHPGVTCENCHDAGSEHVAGGGDITKIFDPLKASPQEVTAKCLSCHAGTHPNFDRSPHAKAGVSCISCHSIHGGNVQLPSQAPAKTQIAEMPVAAAPKGADREHLLKASEPALCYQCHTDVKAAFNLPFHHPVNEGVVKCTDCHNVHGAFQPNNLKTTADQSMICVKCHMDKRGPFVFEHMPVKAEGCMGCHSTPPHGSVNPRMLAMPNINVLCNQCHSQVAADTVHGMGAGSTDSIPCTSCHTYIHGSNLNVAFLR
jgi:predicted CXXCH cytochrome family protein